MLDPLPVQKPHPPIWVAAFGPLALKQVRKAAGHGKISPGFEMKGKFDEVYPNADVCVIGGGPSGMSAGPETLAMSGSYA